MKRFWIVIIILVCAVGLYLALTRGKKSDSDAPQYTEVTPTRGTISRTVSASGSVTSNLDVEIKCKASGTVISLPFDIGDSVYAGDLLVTLDPADEERNMELAGINLYESQARRDRAQENLRNSERELATSRERAQASLDAAQARANQAQASYDRVSELHERGFASQDEVDQAYTALQTTNADLESSRIAFTELDNQEAALELQRQDLNLADAEVQAAEISLETANQRLEETKVYSPMNGYVTQRYVQTGQIISSGISANTGGTAIMQLSDLSRLFVLASVDESNIGLVENGQRVKVNVDAFPDETFTGEVVRMARSGDNVQSVVTFEVRIEVTSENRSLLLPEMTADVLIVVAEAEDALQVPINAVIRSNGKSTVNVLGADGQPESREVTTGIENGEFVQIISGLSGNEIVLVNQGEQQSGWSRSSDENSDRGRRPMMIPLGGGPH
jgi:HlyD family secretion protein